MLDAGHGAGRDFNRGSVIGNEGDNNYKYSLVLKRELEKYGFYVGTTRNSITDNPSLSARGNKAQGYDLFISLHSNAANSSVRGIEIYGDINANSPQLMKNLCANISKAIGTKNRGVRWRTRNPERFYVQPTSPGGSNYYGVLYSNKAKLGMLIEHVFHTNREDCKLYVEKRKEIAQATADTIAEFYGIKKINRPQTKAEVKGVAKLNLTKEQKDSVKNTVVTYLDDEYQKAYIIAQEHKALLAPCAFNYDFGRMVKSGDTIIAVGGDHLGKIEGKNYGLTNYATYHVKATDKAEDFNKDRSKYLVRKK
jgi:N-acetylmuramoyl-L-alanine amidase